MLDNLRAEADRVESVDKLRALDDELCRVEGFIEQALFYARSETVDRDYLIRKYRLGGCRVGKGECGDAHRRAYGTGDA